LLSLACIFARCRIGAHLLIGVLLLTEVFSAAAQLRTLLLALLRACRKGVFIVASEIIQSNFIDLDTALGQ
jgi:hypothetical protein